MRELTDEVLVREVMSSPVIEAEEHETAEDAAKKMMKYGVGAIIVTGQRGEPVGIVTKTDLVNKVIAKNLKPNEVKLKDIMSTPLQTIDPDARIEDALRKMNKLKVNRLAVIYKNRLAGLVSIKDILRVTPEILEIVKENMKIMGVSFPRSREGYMEGYCDNCGEWSDMLLNVEGRYLCEDCRLELLREKRKERG
ncbi:MAG: CBS domain-containing protein [Thaumarchaeota archaeon]|nr:MAG: CBS domain-containing protein [Nitrososphaerota archaeon]